MISFRYVLKVNLVDAHDALLNAQIGCVIHDELHDVLFHGDALRHVLDEDLTLQALPVKQYHDVYVLLE